jgi:hypothetical protein
MPTYAWWWHSCKVSLSIYIEDECYLQSIFHIVVVINMKYLSMWARAYIYTVHIFYGIQMFIAFLLHSIYCHLGSWIRICTVWAETLFKKCGTYVNIDSKPAPNDKRSDALPAGGRAESVCLGSMLGRLGLMAALPGLIAGLTFSTCSQDGGSLHDFT